MSDPSPSAKKMRGDNEQPNAVLDSNDELSRKSDLLKEASEAIEESNRLHFRPVIEESKLGIEIFIGDKIDQFNGLIKTRYSDFIVHEIDPEGNVAHLTSLDAPDDEEPSCSLKLEDFFDRKALVCLANVNSGYLDHYKIDVTGMDKEMRTSLHQAIRVSYDRLESTTLSEVDTNKEVNGKNNKKSEDNKPDSTQQVEDEQKPTQSDSCAENKIESTTSVESSGEKKYIVVKRRSKMSRNRYIWPRNRPEHTHFILYKENKDTMDALHSLSSATNMKPSNFASAGVKDRRAVTTQWISCWKLEPKRLIAGVRRYNKRPFIKVGNFCFKKEPLRLGQLVANKFDIVIRHLVHNREGLKVIESAMDCIKEKGFVNYFGLQRFGTRSIQTHQIGLAILQGDWKKAVDLILSYRHDENAPTLPDQERLNPESNITGDGDGASPSQPQENQKNNIRTKRDFKRFANGAEQHNTCIDLWKSKLDADLVFKKFPHFRFTNEGLIIKALTKSDQSSHDYANAIASLPRNTRSMYVHSYQSYIFNKLATYRLKKHGFKVIPGDLVVKDQSEFNEVALELIAEEVAEADEDNSTGKVADSTVNSGRKDFFDDVEKKIAVVTGQDLDKYSIFDVVLPLIGSKVRIPTNDIGAEMNNLLSEDGLSLDSFKAREKLFVSYGSYRKIMVKPANLTWSIKQYSHPNENLIETDLDRLTRETLSKDKESEQRPASPVKSDSSDEALVVSFTLPPSSYATMCLREIMKKPSTDFNNRF